MAHQPTWRHDASDPPDEERTPADLDQHDLNQDEFSPGEHSDETYLSHIARTLSSHGGLTTSTDLALDIILNQIVEQARLATMATGAVIALARGDEVVCRATSGDNAPQLGVRLNTRTGLSGACIQTREAQRCDNTEIDSRVDAMAARSLGIRSLLVVPVLKGDELVGVFEIFSPRPDAFGDREVQTLNALSRRIVQNVQHAEEDALAAPEEISLDQIPTEPSLVLEPAPESASIAKVPLGETHGRDYWTDALTTVVIGLALLLGWIVGKAGWQSASRARSGPAAQIRSMEPEPSAVKSSVIPAGVEPAAKRERVPALARKTVTAEKKDEAPTLGSLVIYEHGKVIYRDAPAQTSALSNMTPISGADLQNSERVSPVALSPVRASSRLTHSVKPDYPQAARERHIQGPVVLGVQVGKDGAVGEVSVISGDPLLAPAASSAVQQWRFKPYAPAGQPVVWQTQVTVNFVLP